MKPRPRVMVNAPSAAAGSAAREVEVSGQRHALAPLGDAVHGELHWEQPKVLRREWQLVSARGEHVLLHGHGISRRQLQAETPAATWSLDRSWTGIVTMADAEGRELARIPRDWFWKARLELPSGLSLVWHRHWGGDRTLENDEGHELLRIRRRFAFFRFQGTVTLADSARTRPDLMELLVSTFFAWLSEPRGHAH